MADAKSPGLAALLSFLIAGVGQMYAGAPLRGAVFLVAEVGATVYLFAQFSPANFPSIGLILGIVAMMVLITLTATVDAYFAAKSYNKKHFVKCPRCGTNNDKGLPQCLVCWVPLPGAVPAQGPAGHIPPYPPMR